MKILIKIADVLRSVIFFLALVVLLVVTICLATDIKPLVVDSGSMSPKIEAGALAFVNENRTNLAVGDVVAFQKGDILATHRIIKKTDTGYITKGDSNTYTEEISQAQVFGETMFSVPEIGKAIDWATSRTGMIILISLCFCILLMSFLKPVSKEEAEERMKNADKSD